MISGFRISKLHPGHPYRQSANLYSMLNSSNLWPFTHRYQSMKQAKNVVFFYLNVIAKLAAHFETNRFYNSVGV